MPVIALAAVLLALPPLPPGYDIESVRVRFTHFSQNGVGYQSAAGPAGMPGSEQATIEEPQAEVVAHAGPRIVERLWVPIDAVTAASPDHSRYGQPLNAPVDAVTTPSRINVAQSFDSTTTYRWSRTADVSFRAAFHIEEPFESWSFGAAAHWSFADDNADLSASINQIVDWFDHFDLAGKRHGRGARSTSNVNLTLTQVLSTTTIGSLSYGGTLQRGTMGNTWSSVLLSDGTRGDERYPRQRQRHALAARLAQWLPWEGALKLMVRGYADDWGIDASTIEADLAQRVFPSLVVQASYRRHQQTAASFFTTSADPAATGYRTADSDLDAFVAHSYGGLVSIDLLSQLSAESGMRDVHVDLGYEHYVRSNNLTVDATTCGMGFRF
jgi:hypothetical protein